MHPSIATLLHSQSLLFGEVPAGVFGHVEQRGEEVPCTVAVGLEVHRGLIQGLFYSGLGLRAYRV